MQCVQTTANPDLFFNAVVTTDGVYILDLAAKIDATADYICKVKWGDVEFPPPFGREAYPEASYNLSRPKSFKRRLAFNFIYVPKLCACTVFLYMVLACVAPPSASLLVEHFFGSLLGAAVSAVFQLQIFTAE